MEINPPRYFAKPGPAPKISVMSLDRKEHCSLFDINLITQSDEIHPDPADIFEGVFRVVTSTDARELLLHAQLYMAEGDWRTSRSVCQQALQLCTKPKDQRQIRLILKEIELFQDHSFTDLETSEGELDWQEIHQRPVEKVFESHHDMPQSLFFIRFEDKVLDPDNDGVMTSCVRFVVGRRLLSHQYRKGRISELHCSLITPSMLLGALEDQRMREDGVGIFYRPLKSSEKLLFLNKIFEEENMRMAEVVFPFPVLHLDSRQELSCSSSGWQISENHANQLEEGEEILRECSGEFLQNLNQPKLRLFDPACSNGLFLAEMKRAVPDCYTIGQDLSSNMVEYASRRLDEVYCGNCRSPAVDQASVDVVFCRFLNSEIVKTADVMDLLLPVSSCVKVGGYLVIFGHTPVLLSAAELSTLPGWQLLRCVAGSRRWNGIFQFYVCRRLALD